MPRDDAYMEICNGVANNLKKTYPDITNFEVRKVIRKFFDNILESAAYGYVGSACDKKLKIHVIRKPGYNFTPARIRGVRATSETHLGLELAFYAEIRDLPEKTKVDVYADYKRILQKNVNDEEFLKRVL